MSEMSGRSEAAIGRRRWAVAEGYIPPWSHGPQPAMASHESVSLLNAGPVDAHVAVTLYFSDREPVPQGTEYSSVIESDVPIVVQHTRLDSRQAENALMTTVAFPAD